MAKYPLTAEGIEALSATLYGLGDKELRDEAVLLADDPKGWIAAHLELQVHELEYLRSIGERFTLMLGWSLGTALLSRRSITLTWIAQDRAVGGNPEDACMLYNLKLAGHYDGQILDCTGDMNITVSGCPEKKTC